MDGTGWTRASPRLTNPRIVVVGTGRSGTHSIAELLNVPHEPEQFYTVPMAHYYTHRTWSDNDIMEVLNKPDWPPIVVDYKMAELIPLLAANWNSRFVYVTRNAKDTVASMVEKGWYQAEDDKVAAVHVWWWLEPNKLYQDVNFSGFRTRADKLGHMTTDEWAGMGQPERCCWWWTHSTQLITKYLLSLPPLRVWIGRLESLDTVSLLEFCGLLETRMDFLTIPHSDRSEAAWDEEWEPHYVKWCRVLDKRLGYE